MWIWICSFYFVFSACHHFLSGSCLTVHERLWQSFLVSVRPSLCWYVWPCWAQKSCNRHFLFIASRDRMRRFLFFKSERSNLQIKIVLHNLHLLFISVSIGPIKGLYQRSRNGSDLIWLAGNCKMKADEQIGLSCSTELRKEKSTIWALEEANCETNCFFSVFSTLHWHTNQWNGDWLVLLDISSSEVSQHRNCHCLSLKHKLEKTMFYCFTWRPFDGKGSFSFFHFSAFLSDENVDALKCVINTLACSKLICCCKLLLTFLNFNLYYINAVRFNK